MVATKYHYIVRKQKTPPLRGFCVGRKTDQDLAPRFATTSTSTRRFLARSFAGLVAGDWLFFAFAFGEDLVGRNTFGNQICLDSVSTAFGQFLVVFVGTDPVGVTNSNDNFGIHTGEGFDQFVQFCFYLLV